MSPFQADITHCLKLTYDVSCESAFTHFFHSILFIEEKPRTTSVYTLDALHIYVLYLLRLCFSRKH